MAGVFVRLIFAGLVALGAVACASPSAAGSNPAPTATAVPLSYSVVRSDNGAVGIPLFSDADFNALKLRVVNLDDLVRFPTPAVSLAPGTRVHVASEQTVKVYVTPDKPQAWPFERVSVLGGAAAGREGWVSGLDMHEYKPSLIDQPK